MTLPWAFGTIAGGVNSQAITYTLKKFISDPSMIALLTSINLISNVVVGAPCNYMSDRVWTRWGRRRPFLISSALSTAFLMLLIPFLPNIWLLAAVNLVFQVTIDVGTCTEALYFEVIPQPQRGRAVSIRQIMNGIAGMFFSVVLFANFDAKYDFDLSGYGLGHLYWTGEYTLYLVSAMAVLANAALYMFFVRETPVDSPLIGQPFRPLSFLKDVFGDKRWYLVYLYYSVPTVVAAGTSQFGPLVMTDVFGYTKGDMARVGVPSMLITLFVFTPLLGWFSDKIPRTRMFQFGVFGSVAWVTWYWLYIKLLAPGGVPSLMFIFGNGLIGSFFSTAIFVTYGALLFDLIPSNLMGTLASGFGLISSVLAALFMNMCGWFVKYYSVFFYEVNRVDSTRYDYTSIYLFQIIFGAVAIVMYMYFLLQYKRGKVIEYGVLEEKAEQRQEEEGKEAAVLPVEADWERLCGGVEYII